MADHRPIKRRDLPGYCPRSWCAVCGKAAAKTAPFVGCEGSNDCPNFCHSSCLGDYDAYTCDDTHRLRRLRGIEDEILTPGMSQIRRFNSTPHLVRSSIKYKSQEDQYDEIRLLKLQLATSCDETRLLRAQLLRCRNQLQKKYTQLEQCLDQLGQAANDNNHMVCSANVAQYQRRICSLERALGERDDQIRRLRADTRLTVLQECRQQLHICRRQLSRCSRHHSNIEGSATNSSRCVNECVEEPGMNGSPVERLRKENARLSALITEDNNRLGVKLALKYGQMSRSELVLMLEKLQLQLQRHKHQQHNTATLRSLFYGAVSNTVY